MTGIAGLTDPFHGGTASSYVHAHGHTFRWVKGDRYVAVMRGTCVDARRVLIIHDRLAGQHVLETPQPLVDAIPVPAAAWNEPRALHNIADRWAVSRPGRRSPADTARPGTGRFG